MSVGDVGLILGNDKVNDAVYAHRCALFITIFGSIYLSSFYSYAESENSSIDIKQVSEATETCIDPEKNIGI